MHSNLNRRNSHAELAEDAEDIVLSHNCAFSTVHFLIFYKIRYESNLRFADAWLTSYLNSSACSAPLREIFFALSNELSIGNRTVNMSADIKRGKKGR
jgi:hypothetical protein